MAKNSKSYFFLGRGLPENNKKPNTFLTVVTASMFCFNKNEIWKISDKYDDTWTPLNSASYQQVWDSGMPIDTNGDGKADFEKSIDELELYIGKENITGFTFHVPWYWDTSDDTFLPLNSAYPVTWESQNSLHLYKKEEDEGAVHYDNTPRVCTIVQATNTAIVTLNNHGFVHGYTVTISGAGNPLFNGIFVIYNVTGNTFQYTLTGYIIPLIVYNGDGIGAYWTSKWGDGVTDITTVYENAEMGNVARFDWNTEYYSGVAIGVNPAVVSTNTTKLKFKFYSHTNKDYTITVRNWNDDAWNYTASLVTGWQTVEIAWSLFVAVPPTVGVIVHPLASISIEPSGGGLGYLKIDDISFDDIVTYPVGSPMVSHNTLVNSVGNALLSIPYSPTVAGIPIADLRLMPLSSGSSSFGGTPDDDGLQQGIRLVSEKGYKFIFYSFMEVVNPPVNNKPWRGNLLPMVRTIPQLLDDVKGQCLFYAQKLVDWNLKPYAFICCSELPTINKHKTYTAGGQYTDNTGSFDFTSMAKLKEIYTAVKNVFIAGGWEDVKVGYSVDWGEMNGFSDDQGYYWRQMDELFMHQDAVFIDSYWSATEDKTTDNDYEAYKTGWFKNRDWDYYISNYNLWKTYTGGTSPITSIEFASKNLKYWKENYHNHVGISPDFIKTQTVWVPNAKQIFLVEFGCPSVESGASEPNLFFDPLAVQGGVPRGANVNITLTSNATVVEATTIDAPHNYSVGDTIMVSGAEQGTYNTGYNGIHTITEVISPTVFKYVKIGTHVSPATGTIFVMKKNNYVQYYYLKSLLDNIAQGTIPILGLSIWQCDSRPLSILESDAGRAKWGDAFRVGFVHWLKYMTDYTIQPRYKFSFDRKK